MDILLNMTSAQAAALQTGLLIALMMALKLYVGSRRRTLKILSGDVTNAEFGRATRVQLNAVEDVPVLVAGIVALAFLGMPAWYIHMAGFVLLVSRIAHAVGLSGSSGFSWGRLFGTFGTLLVYIAVAGALLFHAFAF
jgi:uncharacterized membrane protein YecN with MAPEG domain